MNERYKPTCIACVYCQVDRLGDEEECRRYPAPKKLHSFKGCGEGCFWANWFTDHPDDPPPTGVPTFLTFAQAWELYETGTIRGEFEWFFPGPNESSLLA